MRILTLLLVLALAGCTNYTRYDYVSDDIEILGGKVQVVFNGSYDEEKLIWGAPYGVQVWFTASIDFELVKIYIENMEVTGVNSGRVYSLDRSESGRVRSNDTEEWTVASSRLRELIEYEPLELKLKLRVCNKKVSKCHSSIHAIPIQLKKGKEMHLDKLDEIMSV